MVFKFGLEYGNIKYGWYKKELYRLPYVNDNRYYNLKKIKPIIIGSTTCYNICRIKFTINKLKKRTSIKNWEVNLVKEKDCPF